VLYLERGPFIEPFQLGDLHLADALAASVAGSIASVAHFLEREQQLFVQTLTALAQAVDLRDDHTGSHTQRVTDYALRLADELKLTPAERYLIQTGTPLHDIGKIGISDAILRKAGPLSEEEFAAMQLHTVKGAAILETIPQLTPLIPIVRHHHERWDGTGYPDRLCGQEISRLGRIVAVADAFDAMTSDRPYRRALPLELAFEEIRKRAGTQFDPDCAAAFLRLRSRLEDAIQRERSLLETISVGKRHHGAGTGTTAPLGTKPTGLLPRLPPAQLRPSSQGS
jgi:HD-GYP domain-containing protein (c-di-GMP phosphodiesterase class II)